VSKKLLELVGHADAFDVEKKRKKHPSQLLSFFHGILKASRRNLQPRLPQASQTC